MTQIKFNKLSIVVPVYNEAKTISEILSLVEEAGVSMEKEIIIVDDYSTDGTRSILQNLEGRVGYRIFYNDKNLGKGASLRRGFAHITGDVVVIQDADLEYSPVDYALLLEPILSGAADVVYGSRFISNRPHRVLYNGHFLANKFLTFFSNLCTGLNLSDMETGYKIFARKVIQEILPHLKSNRFGIEPELTARIAKNKFKVYEVGISYNGRTYEDGKKITWRDGLAAIGHIIRFNLFTHK